MTEEVKAAIIRAEGFVELGMGVDAWDTLEDLPSDGKNHPQVFALRVRILAHEKEWLKVVALDDLELEVVW